jgi:enterochelin esterase-like enzyme
VSLAIHELEGQSPVDSLAVDTFISAHEFPLIEGTTATFVYCGDADEVHLTHWVYGLPSSQPFKRLLGSDLWFFTLELPRKSRVEYKLEIVHGDEHRLIQDPLNPNLAADPYGANSVVHGEGYESPEWSQFDPSARPGELQEHRLASKVFGDVRSVTVYVPARFRQTRRYPLLIVHDGQDFLRFTELKHVLDNLIHRLEIPPLVVALVDSQQRLTEYADDERHAEFLAKELVPVMEDTYPLLGTAGGRALVGASFGAVASLAAAWRYPDVFGNLLLMSGSFAFTDIGEHERGPVFDPVVEFVNKFRKKPGRPAERIYLTCGTYESLIYYNRSILPLLQATGMSVRYVEARDGHNWENWRDRLREGLAWLMPGPLWMVYE